ncbi:c-type cytochrome [Variovorax dokdonensis]|uniref:C-type cytochrome n=1 Tax=Variovorax dokdonensis TaxID=344883 RepID=A0ABT7N539_9BURK|nr:c-type cytochrome [Variovorax dokdonensis]MDM0043035.1 c-type cytochrome [Variovorax dokdonensis]
MSRRLIPSSPATNWRACMLTLAGAWLIDAAGPVAAESTGHAEHPRSTEAGRTLLAQYQCGSCHTIPGVAGAQGIAAGTLEGFGRRSYIAGRLANIPDALAAWIVAPQSLVPGTAMPAMGVSQADAQLMAAYLMTLR